MNLVNTNDLYFKGSKHAILLLHSFTSSAKEMSGLANQLHERGLSCYCLNYKGHGESPEKLFESSVEEAWQSAKEAFDFLQEEGYEDIIVIGQSLGGVMALRLAMQSACKAVVVISAPVVKRPVDSLESRVRHYARRYYSKKNESENWIERYMDQHFPRPVEKIKALQQFIVHTKTVLPYLSKPICLIKGGLDDVAFHESIDLIEENVKSSYIKKITYPNSGHLITLDKDRDYLYQDIELFIRQIVFEN